MTQDQVNFRKFNSFENIQISSDNFHISIYPEQVVIKQKDISGKNKSCSFCKKNWFKLMSFSDIIQACLLMKRADTVHPSYIIPRLSQNSTPKNVHTSIVKHSHNSIPKNFHTSGAKH